MHMKTRVSLKYFVNYCLWKQFFDCNLPRKSSNLTAFPFSVILMPFTLPYTTMGANKWQKIRKIGFIWQLIFRSFH